MILIGINKYEKVLMSIKINIQNIFFMVIPEKSKPFYQNYNVGRDYHNMFGFCDEKNINH